MRKRWTCNVPGVGRSFQRWLDDPAPSSGSFSADRITIARSLMPARADAMRHAADFHPGTGDLLISLVARVATQRDTVLLCAFDIPRGGQRRACRVTHGLGGTVANALPAIGTVDLR